MPGELKVTTNSAPQMATTRVAQILFSGLGGHAGVAFGLIDGDRKRAWHWMLGFLGIEPLLPSYADRCEHLGLYYRYLPAVAGAPWRGWPGVYRWLRKVRPDAIILHSPSAVLPCTVYARLHSVPLLVVEHQQNSLKRRGEWLASRVAMRLADRIVVLTDDYAEGLARGLGRAYQAGKVRVIPNGLDLDRYRPGPARNGGAVRIGMAGRFTSIKRFDLIVGAIAELHRQRPDSRIELSLAGSGETWAETRAAASAQGLEHLVSFEGMLDEEALAEWYRGLDIYAHASAGETLSLALLQAMATARPIVASDVPGIDSLLGHVRSDAVRLVPQATAPAFAEAILQVVERLPSAMSDAALLREECVRRYGNDVAFMRYKGLVDELLGERA
jgi:glycosyltransferase involved in cell wall biosynthesis